MHSQKSHQSSRWSTTNPAEQVTLLERKDQQIRRLTTELEQQRKRADNAVKMLETFKNMHQKTQESMDGYRTQINRRLKAEQDMRELKKRNKQLEEGISFFLQIARNEPQEQSIIESI